MRILGIDPGTRIVGYGVIEVAPGRWESIEFGVISAPLKLRYADRLRFIYDEICQVVGRTNPDVMAIEKVYYGKSGQSAIKIGEGRAVAILCAAKHGISVMEFTPAEAKKATVGTGKADKVQVQRMVKALLNLQGEPPPADAADALALAICCGQRVGH